jgi:hypothetical protein
MEDSKFLSRKFILTILVLILVPILPIGYKELAVSDAITMAVLGIIASVCAAYGILNLKDAQNEIAKKLSQSGGASESDQASK